MSNRPAPPTDWPYAASETARLIRGRDWSATPLGPIEHWSQSLRTALDMVLAMPGPATLLWGSSHIQLYNDAYIAIAQARHPALLGKPVAEGWPDAYEAAILPLLEVARDGRATRLIDYGVALGNQNGEPEERFFDTDWVPVRDEAGAVAGALQMLVEVTDRRRAERALRESEARNRLLVESWAQAVWETDPDGVVVADSPSWRAYTGQTLNEWLGYGWLDAIHPDDRAYAERQWREAMAARTLVDAEFRLRAPDGGWRWTNIRAAPVVNEGGRIEKIVGMNVDIDARRQAEVALRESEERLRALFESIDEGFSEMQVILDEDGHVVDWLHLALNGNFSRVTGIPDITGRLASEVFPNLEGEWFRRMDLAYRTGEPQRFETELAELGRWFDNYITRLGGEDDTRVFGVFADITERKSAERTLRESEERQAFLLKLSDTLRGEVDERRIEQVALEMLAEQLSADRTYITTSDYGKGETVVPAEVQRVELPRLTGVFRHSDWPESARRVNEGTIVVTNAGEDANLSEHNRRSFEATRIGALIGVGLRRGVSDISWTLAAATAEPRSWTPGEVLLVEEAAERTLSALQRARSETALRESEERQKFLLHLSDTLRPLTDAADIEKRATRLLGEQLEADRCFLTLVDEDGERLQVREEHLRSGASSVLGDYHFAQFGGFVGPALHAGRILAVEDVAALPDLPPAERASYAAVDLAAYLLMPLVRNGRLAAYLTINHRTPRAWSEADQSIARQTADRAWAAIERARAEAELREGEERQAFLLKLSDALRPVDDPVAIQRTATRLLGEQLNASRVFYVLVEEDGDTAEILGDYANGVPARVGRYSLSAFSSFAAGEWRAGRTASTDDVDSDPRWGEAERAAYASVSTRAGFGVPLIKEGRLVALLGVNQSSPRRWTDAERDLAHEVAERTWAAVARARAEAALRESEERFRQFGEASQDVLWIRDAETFQWEYLTRAFGAIYGLDRTAALSGDNLTGWAELIVPEDRERALASLRRVRDGEWVTFEYRIRRPSDGQTRWLRNTDFPIRDASGLVRHIGGIGHDVTELKRAEEALASTEMRQRALIEGMPQLVWRAVDGGEWTWASPQWTAFTGQAEAESRGWGWLDALHPDDRDSTRAAWSAAMDRGGLDAEHRLRHSEEGGYRWFHTRATPVRDDRGRIVEWLGTSTDIHALREMQERQKVLVAELQHRTRNLMGVVRSMSEKTARASADLPDFRERFRDRLEALARVQGLLSRLNEHDRVTFDELVRAELDAMDGNADRISLEGPSGVRLRSSMVQTLAMAIHELATNAVKYGALGQPCAQLTVTWTLEPDGSGDRSRLRIDWRETGVTIMPGGAKPKGSGQGRELIERALPYQLSAETTFELAPDGVHCTITIPISRATSPREVELA